ncbi:MAG TPA: 4Fe-4S dicluster domain-containing protein [Steroidobacteraceae bacterium]|nr:4Fe-4S dicluster domain-containing protein [Steroidobacteraceae bacterium]
MNRMNQEPHDWDAMSDFALERRRVLKLMAASAALASGACSGPPAEKIVPFVKAPEDELPGKPLFYATAIEMNGYGMGVLVENNDGRPTKVEGNPAHPASLGATDTFAQAQVLDLWDPARSKMPLHRGQFATWLAFVESMQRELDPIAKADGNGLYLLTRDVSSPTMQAQLLALRQRFPQMKWHRYDPLHRDNELLGAQLAFSRPVDTIYHFDRAKTLVAFDADFMFGRTSSVRYARDWVRLRNPDTGPMSRMYVLESMPTITGAKADHRRAATPIEIEQSFLRIARAFGLGPGAEPQESFAPFEAAIVDDLRANAGSALVVPGESLPPALHALAHALNHRLDGAGRTFSHIEPVAFEPTPHIASIRALARDIKAGRVRTLVILGGNPAYDAPADLDFARLISTVPASVHLSLYEDETSAVCSWHVPRTHEFEQWSDTRAFDGTASIVQPLIAPLYGGVSPHQLLNVLLGIPNRSAHETVRANWQATTSLDEAQWRKILREGIVTGTASRPLELTPALPRDYAVRSDSPNDLTLRFSADQSVLDGRFAPNAWLQEIPRTFSKITWDNAAYLSPTTAHVLNVATGDVIDIELGANRVRAGVFILPAHADRCITLPLGYGRTRAGAIGTRVGFNAYALRTSDTPWSAQARVRKVSGHWQFATTQNHARMEGRNLVRRADYDEFARNPHFANDAEEERVPEQSLYPEYRYDGYKWGMAIDLNACIGCNACTIACQAENNIAVVGKDQVQRGREMHWIRVDRYFIDTPQGADTAFQPVPCMHCEHAPCEEVCPVGATVHDSQGLNLQVYNRCVGTRFCSNNCPYKVRRFNFLQYSNQREESLKAVQNPEVTVRERGVMEKCTYCIQRIQRGRIEAQKLERPLHDGEVVTACQAACPTNAITFGDLNDRDAQVTRVKRSPRNYALLAELNTRPRTTYLAEVVNRRTSLDATDKDES